MNVGDIDLGLNINRQGFNRQLNGIASGAQAGVKKAFLPLGKLIGGALAIGALVAFGKSCTDLGSDLAEVQNVVDVTFGSMSNEIDEFAKTAITSFGLSETSAKKYASTMGAMLKSMQIPTKQALEMSKTITALSADMASFYNLKSEEAFGKIRAGISGETEPLKQLGINMSVANMQAYALSKGMTKAYAKMSQSEQTLLRYNYLLSVTADAQGDFARTSDGWANQTRILSEQFNSLKATLGQAFINVLTPVVKWLNAIILKLQVLAGHFKAFTDAMFGVKSASGGSGIAKVVEDMGGVGTAADDASSAIGGMGDSTAAAAKKAKGALAGFDEINSLNMSNDGGSTGGAGDVGGMGGIPEIEVPNIKETIFPAITAAIETFKKVLQPTIDALKRLSEAMKPFVNFVWQGLKDFYELCLKPIGEWVFGEGLPRFIDALAKGFADVNWERINESLSKVYEAITPFAINVGEGLLWFWENVLVPIGAWTADNIVPLFLDILASSISILNEILLSFQPLASWLFDNFLKPIAEWTGGVIIAALTGLSSALENVSNWMKNNQSVVSGITTTLVSFFAVWKAVELMAFIQMSGGVAKALGTITAAIKAGTIAKIADKFETMALTAMYAKDFIVSIASSTVALVKQTAAFVASKVAIVAGAIAQGAMTAATVAWNIVCATGTALTTAFGIAVGILTSPVTLVIAAIAALVVGIVLLVKHWDVVKQTAVNVWDSIKSAWSSASTWFSTNVISPIGNAFSTMKSTLNNIWDSIGNKVKSIVNVMIDALNKLIKGVNKVKFNLPSVMGGGSVGFSIPEIPRLARGGVVDQPTLAMVGEAGKEAVVPLENNTGWTQQVADMLANALLPLLGGIGGGSSENNRDIVMQLNGVDLVRAFLPDLLREFKRKGIVLE